MIAPCPPDIPNGVRDLDDAYESEWRVFGEDPGRLIFLVGCQRSGTTWLHTQLARSGAFRYLSAYDVHANGRIVHNHRQNLSASERRVFNDRLRRSLSSDRGIDTIRTSDETPEEYGLVISGSDIRYNRADTKAASLPRLQALCAKKALIEGRELPLLLKSPPDYPGAMNLLAETWPGARFVAIQRHPLCTLASQVRAWRRLVIQRNEYLMLIDCSYRALFNDATQRIRLGFFLHSEEGIAWLADCILHAHAGFLDIRRLWPSDRLLTVRYEDLCANQRGELARISAFLDVEFPLPSEAPAPRASVIPLDVRRAFNARLHAFRPFLDQFGYADEP